MSFQPSTPPPKSRGPWIVAVAAAVVVVIGAVVVLDGGGDDDATSSTTLTPTTAAVTGPTVPPTSLGPTSNGGPATATAAVTVTGAPLPVMAERGADAAVGQVFPDLSGSKVLDSSPLSITDDGRPKVILFLAHWCPNCQREVPVIQDWIDANGMPDVDLYAVSTHVDPSADNYPPADWLTAEGWIVPTMADDAENAAFTAAGLTSFPSFVAVGADGTVAARATGELSIEQFEVLLAGARA